MPQLWQPPSGTHMTNDINENKPPEESGACIALSKNDSYVMSASGGKVSLFNMMTFKVTFLLLPWLSLIYLNQINQSPSEYFQQGFVRLTNWLPSQVMTTFMPPPPAATFLAFHPQDNNIVAIGMEDSTIQIYKVRVDEVKKPLYYSIFQNVYNF